MSEQNKEITSQSTFADFLYILGDVAAGKISLKEACKHLADKDKDRAKRLLETTKQAFTIIKSSIKERKQELDMQAQYDMSVAAKININGNTYYMGLKPKQKKSGFRQMFENLGRTLKTTGSVLTGKKTIKQATKEEFQAVQESLSNSSNVYRGFRATAETISDFTKNIKELRGLETSKGGPSKKETNPYDKLDDKQFSCAMHAAYVDIVRMEHIFGVGCYEPGENKAIDEINRLLESAQKRFPSAKISDKGSYFTDEKLKNVEAQLFAFMREYIKKNPSDIVAKDEIQRYECWRQGKKYIGQTIGNITLSEEPFHNGTLFGPKSIRYDLKDKEALAKMSPEIRKKTINKNVDLCLYNNALEKGRSVMSEKTLAMEKAKLEKLTIR